MKIYGPSALAVSIFVLLAVGCAPINPINDYPFITPEVREAERVETIPVLSLYERTDRVKDFDREPPSDKSRPRSILIVGDSLSVGLGATMVEALKDSKDIKVYPEGKISSGLNSPSFFNWPEKLRELVAKTSPDAVVVLIGGNDAHNGPGSKEWAEKFRERVQDFLQIASELEVEVYWVELPPMKDKRFSRNAKVANYVMESVCSKIGNCHFVPTWELCSGNKGGFAVSVKVDGEWIMLRVSDGAHFTHVGYRILSRHVIKSMAYRLNLKPPPEPELPEELENGQTPEGPDSVSALDELR
jgi:hypothetical protein